MGIEVVTEDPSFLGMRSRDVLLLEDPSEAEVVNTIQGHVPIAELKREPKWSFTFNEAGAVTSITFAQVWTRNGEVVRQDADTYLCEGVQARAEQGNFN